jgi:predicted nucleic acid-binding protein
MRVFLDANVIFSAAKSDGAIRRLLVLLEEAGHACCADSYVVEEARRNLAAKDPAGLAALATLLPRLSMVEMRAVDPEIAAGLPLCEKDRPVLAAAVRGGCDALVTGDRTHFGPLFGRAVHGVTIHSPRSLAEALLTRKARGR